MITFSWAFSVVPAGVVGKLLALWHSSSLLVLKSIWRLLIRCPHPHNLRSIGIGFWREGSRFAGENDFHSYTCDEMAHAVVFLPETVGLDAQTVLAYGLSNWKGEDLSEGDPLTFGSGDVPEVDERFFREDRKSEESLNEGSSEGFGFHSRLDETKWFVKHLLAMVIHINEILCGCKCAHTAASHQRLDVEPVLENIRLAKPNFLVRSFRLRAI
jgi:hypothetical protein